MDEYKTTWREKLGYGIGAVGLDLSYGKRAFCCCSPRWRAFGTALTTR